MRTLEILRQTGERGNEAHALNRHRIYNPLIG